MTFAQLTAKLLSAKFQTPQNHETPYRQSFRSAASIDQLRLTGAEERNHD